MDDEFDSNSDVDVSDAGTTDVPADNPAWNDAWSALREDPSLAVMSPKIQAALKPVLQRWDKDRQDQVEKYKPYSEFVDNGVNVDTLRAGVNAVSRINNDLPGFYKQIGEVLEQAGLMPTAQNIQAAAQQIQSDGDDEDEDPNAARLNAAEIQLQELQTREQQRDFNVLKQQEYNALDSVMKKVEKSHGESNLKDLPFRGQGSASEYVLAVATSQLAQNPNARPNIEKIYESWATTMRTARSLPPPGRNAPAIVGQQGGNASALPQNTEAGKIPSEVLTGKPSAFNKWVMENVMPGLRNQ